MSAFSVAAVSLFASPEAGPEALQSPFQVIKDVWGPEATFELVTDKASQSFEVGEADATSVFSVSRWRVKDSGASSAAQDTKFLVQCFNSDCLFVVLPSRGVPGGNEGEMSWQRGGDSFFIVSAPARGIIDAKSYDKDAKPALTVQVIGPGPQHDVISGYCPLETVNDAATGKGVEFYGRCKPLKESQLIPVDTALKIAEQMEDLSSRQTAVQLRDPTKIQEFQTVAQNFLKSQKERYETIVDVLRHHKISVPRPLLTVSSYQATPEP
ncbi:MAG: hypothetical protein M3N08_05500 [Pseudomonadota bacterium]|nr:hypothetical protein [Pseudomonadota bacterium]